MYKNEREYAPAVEALKPVLHNLPGKIVAIGGLPGVGKTTLGRCLAYRFNVSLIETDLFLIRNQGTMVYRENWISQVMGSRLDKADSEWRRPVIVEGVTVLHLLDSIDRKPDFIIHIINEDAPESSGPLADDLARYDAQYAPAAKADIILTFSAEPEEAS